ncbi:MAG: helix-turn-helix transcriptional regulator, partial [Spirochaetales bacterium]|nr:helix-turn-helix transcriptional regulator [Spirochaetales bacterium]
NMTEYELRIIYTSNIRRIRNEQDLTQFELAEKAGLADKYIGYIETGRQWGSIETLLKLANALGVEPADLLRANNNNNNNNNSTPPPTAAANDPNQLLSNLKADFTAFIDMVEPLVKK